MLKPGITIVLGFVCSGKTTFTENHTPKEYKIIHTDDYIEYGHNLSVQQVVEDVWQAINDGHKNIVIEGVLGFRLIRRHSFRFDHIIICEASEPVRIKRYQQRDTRLDEGGRTMVFKMDAQLNSFWDEYIESFHRTTTSIIRHDTTGSND